MKEICSTCLKYEEIIFSVDFFEFVESQECLGILNFCSGNCVKAYGYTEDVVYCFHSDDTFMQFVTYNEFMKFIFANF